MKLIRFGEAGKEKPGVIMNDMWFDVSGNINDYDENFFDSDGLSLLKSVINEKQFKEVSRDTRLGAPIARPSLKKRPLTGKGLPCRISGLKRLQRHNWMR